MRDVRRAKCDVRDDNKTKTKRNTNSQDHKKADKYISYSNRFFSQSFVYIMYTYMLVYGILYVNVHSFFFSVCSFTLFILLYVCIYI